MNSAHELLTIRVGEARAQFLGDVASALKEATSGAEFDPPTQADIEEALKVQIAHGKRLLEMAEAACNDLASYVKLQATIHKVLTGALAEAAKHFRDCLAMVTVWMDRQGLPLEGAQEMATLTRKLDDCRAQLLAAWPDVFPGLEMEKVNQAIHDLDCGKGRSLESMPAELTSFSWRPRRNWIF